MTDHEEVDRLVAVITIDCYNLAEDVTAFYETFTHEVPLPTTATVLETTIDVVGIDIAEDGEHLTARCRRGEAVQDLHLSDLVFLPDTTAGWIHAAYRRCLGLMPHPAAMPQGWAPSCPSSHLEPACRSEPASRDTQSTDAPSPELGRRDCCNTSFERVVSKHA